MDTKFQKDWGIKCKKIHIQIFEYIFMEKNVSEIYRFFKIKNEGMKFSPSNDGINFCLLDILFLKGESS